MTWTLCTTEAGMELCGSGERHTFLWQGDRTAYACAVAELRLRSLTPER